VWVDAASRFEESKDCREMCFDKLTRHEENGEEEVGEHEVPRETAEELAISVPRKQGRLT
jgi:hypothetical protein